MKNRTNINTGNIGEEAACKFLTTLGYKIIERNFRKRYGELDIVALDGQTLVFVEVKTRRGNVYGLPEESITPWKIRHLVRSAHFYQITHKNMTGDIRLDAVSVSLASDDSVKDIKLFKNITL